VNRSDIEAVVFDMGGVLVRLGSLPDLLAMDGGADWFWPRWLASPAVRDFERGAITPDDFARSFADEFCLTISPEEFLHNFSRFCQGLLPGAVELVRSVPPAITTALLSNTNDLHWRTQPDAATVATLCHQNFLSYRMGLLKPDRPCFDHVTNSLGVDPKAVLFLDDNHINVQGARAAGWQAEATRGVEEATEALVHHGVIRGR
jgi:putative hydrolase of the HAD superfamily